MTPPVQADITTQPAVAARPTASDTQAIQLAQQPAEPNQQPAEPNQQPAEPGQRGTADGTETSPPVAVVNPMETTQQPVAVETTQQDVVMETEQQNIDGSSRPELYRLPSNVDEDDTLNALR